MLIGRDFFEEHRVISLMIFLLIIWGSIFFLLWEKATVIQNNPCEICAKQHGDDVICSLRSDPMYFQLVYYFNGSAIKKFNPTKPDTFTLNNET